MQWERKMKPNDEAQRSSEVERIIMTPDTINEINCD